MLGSCRRANLLAAQNAGDLLDGGRIFESLRDAAHGACTPDEQLHNGDVAALKAAADG